MIILYNGGVIGTPQDTQEGLASLIQTMQYAVSKWHKEGKPLSNQHM